MHSVIESSDLRMIVVSEIIFVICSLSRLGSR